MLPSVPVTVVPWLVLLASPCCWHLSILGGPCDDADMDSSPVADNGGPVATEAGCNAVVLVEPGVWLSPPVGTSSSIPC